MTSRFLTGAARTPLCVRAAELRIFPYQGETMRLRFTLLAILVIAIPAAADEAKSSKTVRLFNVGNSFSQNATRYLRDLAKADGNLLVHQAAVVGGASMAVHWEKVEQHEKDPQDKRGIYFAGKGFKELLASERWDFVTIQQASIKSHDPKTYQPYAGQLRAYIAKHAPQAELLLHETWEYRVDDPRFAVAKPPSGEPATQEAMYQGLAAAYRAIAKLGVRIIPVGDAFHLVDTDPKWSFKPDTKFDRKSAQAPSLPDQMHSLHVGLKWVKSTKGEQELRMDGHHANTAGEYLGACVFYEVLYGQSVIGNTFVPPGVDTEFARFLRETAHRAVEESRSKK
jgi:hypothetical protein